MPFDRTGRFVERFPRHVNYAGKKMTEEERIKDFLGCLAGPIIIVGLIAAIYFTIRYIFG